MESNSNGSINNKQVVVEIYKGGEINIVPPCSLFEIESALQRLSLFVEQTKRQTIITRKEAEGAPAAPVPLDHERKQPNN